MPHWKHAIPLPHALSSPEQAERLAQLAHQELQKQLQSGGAELSAVQLGREVGVAGLEIRSPWITGSLRFSQQELVIDADLKLLAWPFRSRIQKKLEEWLSRQGTRVIPETGETDDV